MSNGKHIGIVACSAEGAALCYRTICAEAKVFMGEHRHPEISIHTFNLDQYMQPIYIDDWDAVGRLMNTSAKKLVSIGAELLICPDNTIHKSYTRATEGLDVPWLHIAEEVIKIAAMRGFKKLALTGTKYLMESAVYPKAATSAGIEIAIPDKSQRATINDIIFNQLVYGDIREESREVFFEVISELKNNGCDAVILGCTEIPLIIDDSLSPIPTLDSTRILARAALRTSLA